MRYVVEIDETKSLGKSALSILKSIAKKKDGITIKKVLLNELKEDTKMVKRMLQARKNGFIDTGEFLAKLKSQL
jgi:hypothetical protein